MLLTSRISLTKVTSCSPLSLIIFPARVFSSSSIMSCPMSSMSENPTMALRGVRISWLRFWMKKVFIFSAA